MMSPRHAAQLDRWDDIEHITTTAEGRDDPQESACLGSTWVRARGYTVAPHTIDSSDDILNRVYVQVLGRDEATARRQRARGCQSHGVKLRRTSDAPWRSRSGGRQR